MSVVESPAAGQRQQKPSEREQSWLELSRRVAEENDRRALMLQIRRPDYATRAAMGDLR